MLLAHAALGCRETLTERIIRTLPAKEGNAFLAVIDEPLPILKGWGDEDFRILTASSRSPAFWSDEDTRDPKIIRRRFQEHLQALRGKEPAFVKLETRRTGKRPAARWGSRPREQRTRA